MHHTQNDQVIASDNPFDLIKFFLAVCRFDDVFQTADILAG
jgi:hypothetical protein